LGVGPPVGVGGGGGLDSPPLALPFMRQSFAWHLPTQPDFELHATLKARDPSASPIPPGATAHKRN
jgi:hypothetical protein